MQNKTHRQNPTNKQQQNKATGYLKTDRCLNIDFHFLPLERVIFLQQSRLPHFVRIYGVNTSIFLQKYLLPIFFN